MVKWVGESANRLKTNWNRSAILSSLGSKSIPGLLAVDVGGAFSPFTNFPLSLLLLAGSVLDRDSTGRRMVANDGRGILRNSQPSRQPGSWLNSDFLSSSLFD